VDGTAADGIVRVRNHGTDHANPGVRVADSPLYARLGYSTATFPDLVPESLDNAVVFADAAGRLTHRTGFSFLGHFELDGVQVGGCRFTAHWIDVDPDGGPDHGSGAAGTATPGPDVTVASLTRGAVELRVVRVRHAGRCSARLRIGGWPVDASSPLSGSVRPVSWGGELPDAGTWHRAAPHPVGEHLSIPWVGTPGAVADGDYAAVVVLSGEGGGAGSAGTMPMADGHFAFPDGTTIDVAAALARLVSE
jgi:hypothetical protein